MSKMTFELGLHAGYDQAHDVLRNIALRLGTKRFGAPSEQIEARIRSVEGSRELEQMVKSLLDVKSWNELLQPFATICTVK